MKGGGHLYRLNAREQCVKRGDNVTIKPGAVIGFQGFSFKRDEKGVLHHNLHKYKVILEDDVWIGANAVIDRGSWRDTIIGKGTKINNHAHIGHNVRIGKHCIIGVGAKIAGSTEIGDYVEIWNGADIKQHLKIGDYAVIGMGAVVIHDVPPKTTVVGNPACEIATTSAKEES